MKRSYLMTDFLTNSIITSSSTSHIHKGGQVETHTAHKTTVGTNLVHLQERENVSQLKYICKQSVRHWLSVWHHQTRHAQQTWWDRVTMEQTHNSQSLCKQSNILDTCRHVHVYTCVDVTWINCQFSQIHILFHCHILVSANFEKQASYLEQENTKRLLTWLLEVSATAERNWDTFVQRKFIEVHQ